MHELSVAQGILDLVHEHVPEERGGDVRVVRLRVGPLAGVLVESLVFCFEALVQNTELARARLAVDRVPLTLRCTPCAEAIDVETLTFRCPRCAGTETALVSGRELDVVEIELAEQHAEIP